jgi:hypothetical protein
VAALIAIVAAFVFGRVDLLIAGFAFSWLDHLLYLFPLITVTLHTLSAVVKALPVY